MASHQAPGKHTVTPRIITSDPQGLVGFVTAVFGGQGELRGDAPAEVRIGDSIVMISSGGGLREVSPAFLYVYVEDTDATYRRAISAGAISIEAPEDQFYGDRRAMVKDAWGNTWQIATHR
ncbi:MAG: VOC family protein [Steroidobacterales bacterium]